MAQRWTLLFVLESWALASAVTLGLQAGNAAAAHWGEVEGAAAYPAVESVSEEASKTYNLPIELNDEPYVLVEWTTGLTRRRPGFQYPFPPGIILSALLTSAALLFVLNKKYRLLSGMPEESARADVESIASEEEVEGSSDVGTSTVLEGNLALQAALERLSSDLDKAVNDTKEKRGAAVAALEAMPAEAASMFADVVSLLSSVTEKLTPPADAIKEAVAAMQEPFLDSQGLSRVESALETPQREGQKVSGDQELKLQLERAAAELKQFSSGSTPNIMTNTQEQPGTVTQEAVITACTEWLEALEQQESVVLSSAPTLTSAADQLRRD